MKRIIIHLGTNDVSKCKTDKAQATVYAATATSETHKKFPEVEIAFSRILPRKGKSAAIGIMTSTLTAVNGYIRKLALKESYLSSFNNVTDIKAFQLEHSTAQVTPQAFILASMVRICLLTPFKIFQLWSHIG